MEEIVCSVCGWKPSQYPGKEVGAFIKDIQCKQYRLHLFTKHPEEHQKQLEANCVERQRDYNRDERLIRGE